jgi:hypothetical protein
LPFDGTAGIVPNDSGRVIDIDGEPLPGAYVTGWIKRDPIGLIGHTKSDAAQAIDLLLSDLDARSRPNSPNSKRSTAISTAATSPSPRSKAGKSSTPTRSSAANPRAANESGRPPRRNGAHLPRLIAPRFPKIWPILQVESASTPLELGTRWRGQTGTRGLVTAGRAVRQEHFFALLEESVLGAQTLGHPDELRLAMVAWMERNRSALLGRGEYDNRVHERIKGVPLRWDDQ